MDRIEKFTEKCFSQFSKYNLERHSLQRKPLPLKTWHNLFIGVLKRLETIYAIFIELYAKCKYFKMKLLKCLIPKIPGWLTAQFYWIERWKTKRQMTESRMTKRQMSKHRTTKCWKDKKWKAKNPECTNGRILRRKIKGRMVKRSKVQKITRTKHWITKNSKGYTV